jgi:hypothetical protein
VSWRESKGVRWLVHGVLAALGLGTLLYLVLHVGPARLWGTLRALAPLLPAVFALEGGRVMADAWRTRLLYAHGGYAIAFGRVLSVQLASYPINLLVPAGGAAAEAFKATVLAADARPSLAAAVATSNQAIALLGGFVISIPCVLAALRVWGLSGFTIAIAIQAATAVGLALFIQTATRQRLVGVLAGRVSEKAGAALGSYREAVVGLPFLALAPLGAAVVNRVILLAELGLLAAGAGAAIGLEPALLALGVQLVGGAAGDVVPGQIGATDASFALAAEPLGIELASAVSIPIAMHALQLTWALIGALVPIRGVR